MANTELITDALVLRVLPSGDNDKLLTLLCPHEGRINVIAHGARSLHSKLMGVARPFVWGNFELRSKGGGFWVRDASVLKNFEKLSKDIELMYLSQYISDVACELSGAAEEPGELLPLVLNTFYALSNGYDKTSIKAAFELRAASISGYLPELHTCTRCECESAEAWYLDIMSGGIVCNKCVASSPPVQPEAENNVDIYGKRTILLPLGRGVLEAMRYVTECEPKRVFSFKLKTDDDRGAFANACEMFLLNHLERGFSSLKVYHELSSMK